MIFSNNIEVYLFFFYICTNKLRKECNLLEMSVG